MSWINKAEFTLLVFRELGEIIKAEIENRGGKFINTVGRKYAILFILGMLINSAAKAFICGTPVVSDGETVVCSYI